jgi:hypothetical protein
MRETITQELRQAPPPPVTSLCDDDDLAAPEVLAGKVA